MKPEALAKIEAAERDFAATIKAETGVVVEVLMRWSDMFALGGRPDDVRVAADWLEANGWKLLAFEGGDEVDEHFAMARFGNVEG